MQNIKTKIIKDEVRKIQNWKSSGPDGVQGYWLKKLTTLHECIAKQVDNIISNREAGIYPSSFTNVCFF